MECCSSFWSRHLEAGPITPWIIRGVNYLHLTPPRKATSTEPLYIADNWSTIHDNYANIVQEGVSIDTSSQKSSAMDPENVKALIEAKANKSRNFYRTLCGSEPSEEFAETGNESDSQHFQEGTERKEDDAGSEERETIVKEAIAADGDQMERHRRTGVYEIEEPVFQSVRTLTDKFQVMVDETTRKLQEVNVKPKVSYADVKEEGFLAPPPSGYCSSSASGGSDDERDRNWKHTNLHRSGSSDSAVGLNQSDEELSPTTNSWQEVFASAGNTSVDYTQVSSPYSPRGSVDHINVPSKTLLESQFVPFPIALDRKLSDSSEGEGSRRPSCVTDDGEELDQPVTFRYWRTPSVVVSDYSDDVVGLSLEEIEFFSRRKETSSSPDSSLHSSCSNLNYCGSSLSNLDSEYVLRTPFRKHSASSASSGEEDDSGVQGGIADEKEKGDKGEKGHKYGEKGSYKKGHSTKGGHDVHKLDEYKKEKHFFDEDHDEGHHEKHGGFHHEDGFKKGGSKKGGHYKGGHHEDHYGKKGHHEKGAHHHEDKGHKHAGGHDSHYEHGDKYGKKGGKHGHKKWGFSSGNGGGGHGGGHGGGQGGGHAASHSGNADFTDDY